MKLHPQVQDAINHAIAQPPATATIHAILALVWQLAAIQLELTSLTGELSDIHSAICAIAEHTRQKEIRQ